MLVSGGQGIMRLEATYGVSRIAHAVRFCCVRCSLFQAVNRSVVPLFPLPFPPSLVELVSIGLVSISTDLVSVTVPGGWLPLVELPWMPECPAQGLWLQGSLLALESPPTFAGTISKRTYWR